MVFAADVSDKVREGPALFAGSASAIIFWYVCIRREGANGILGARHAVGEWLSLVEHLVRDQGVGGSNPLLRRSI